MRGFQWKDGKLRIDNYYLRMLLDVFFACVYALMLFAWQTTFPAMAAASNPTQAKNVIMIQTDHELSYLHGTDDDTYQIYRPNYDEFRAESVDFVNAKSINPLCSPARRTMLTAVYPHQHGIITNSTGIAPNPNIDTIYDVLLENRFGAENIYFYGKTHWSGSIANDTPQAAYGIQGWSTEGYGQPYKTQKYKDYLADNDYFGSDEREPVMTLIGPPLYVNPALKEGDTFNIANMNIITGNYFGIMKAPKEFHEAFFLADMVNEQLEELAQADNDHPFVMSVNMWGPHHPYYPTQEYVDLYTDENGVIGGNIEEYPSFYDEFINKPEVYGWDQQAANNPNLSVPNEKTWEEFRKYMAIAYAQTTLVDDAIGTILDTIEATGLAEDTVVIWTNDHGDALGSHGGHVDKECYMIEEILDINMTVRDPDFADLAGTVNTSYVNTADVPVTMLDVVGLEFPEDVAGMSLLDLIDGSAQPREYMVCETNGHFTATRARTVYYDGFKYTYYYGDIDELYDLQNDKHEMNNLIFEPEMQGRIAVMKRMLREWQIEEKDNIPLVNL